MTTVSLVLGSGGARGLAHIGIIRWLEEHDFEIKSISGASSGALVGGAYAAGKLDPFEDWVRTIERKDIYSLLDLAWNRAGLMKGEKLIKRIQDIVGSHKIEDLPIKYTAVSVNLNKGSEVWINSGDLYHAIRASVSIPLLLTPVRDGDATLVDGGVLNPVPVTPTIGDNTDITIAVNLDADIPSATTQRNKAKSKKKKEARDKEDGFRGAVAKFNQRFFDTKIDDDKPENSFFSVALQAFETMQSQIARQKLAAYPPDHLIRISRHAGRTLEVDRAEEFIDLGYKSAQETLGHLITDAQSKSRKRVNNSTTL